MQEIRHTLQYVILLVSISLTVAVGQANANSTVTSISIPSIGVETTIVAAPLTPDFTTWDVSHLSMNVGHFVGTAWFGTGGNVVLGGHSETPNFEPDVFYGLDAVQVGDVITVGTNGTEYQYIVSEVRSVSQFDVSVVYPTSHEQLTLITCQRGTYDGNVGQYQNRVVVVAVPL